MDAFISGAWRTAKRGEVLIGGAWRRITRAEVYRSGTWRSCLSFVPPLSVSVSPASADGTVNPPRPSAATVTSNQVQATPSGGAAPYRYAWSVLDGGATATSPNMAATAFRAFLGSEQNTSGTARVTCTDNSGNTAVADIPYFLYNQSFQ